MTLFALGLFVSLFLLWRAVLPLECKWYWKLAAGSAAFAVGFKFKIIQLLGGNYFAPELPAGVLLAAALIYVTAFFFLLFIAATDTVLFCITCSRTLYRNLKEKKHDFTPLLRKHPLLNKIHAAGLAGAFLFAIAGICNGLAMPRIRQVEVISDRVPAESDGLRLAVLADLHVDRLNDRPRIRKIVALTNSLKPDFICLAGDFSDGAQKHHLEALSELAALRARYGVYGVPGNHEYYRGYHELMAHFKKTGLPMLINENVYFKDLKLLIGGIPDGHARKLGLAAPDISAALSGGDPGRGHRPSGYGT